MGGMPCTRADVRAGTSVCTEGPDASELDALRISMSSSKGH
jgi:hypothetical protein